MISIRLIVSKNPMVTYNIKSVYHITYLHRIDVYTVTKYSKKAAEL